MVHRRFDTKMCAQALPKAEYPVCVLRMPSRFCQPVKCCCASFLASATPFFGWSLLLPSRAHNFAEFVMSKICARPNLISPLISLVWLVARWRLEPWLAWEPSGIGDQTVGVKADSHPPTLKPINSQRLLEVNGNRRPLTGLEPGLNGPRKQFIGCALWGESNP